MPNFTPWQSVTSSNLIAVRFALTESERGLLEVRFQSGKVYRYQDVPEWIYKDLADPEFLGSKGQWFNKAVVKAGYKYERIKRD